MMKFTNMLAKINVFSLHYFLWFGALAPIYSYVGVYAEHYARASPSQIGLLNMILPFITIASSVYFCSLTDRYRMHRSSFLGFLAAALIGYSSYASLPFFVDSESRDERYNRLVWILICAITSVTTIAMNTITCLSDTLAVNSSNRHKISYGKIRLWGTLGWGFGSLLLAYINQTTLLPLFVPGLLMTSVLILFDLVATSLWPNKDEFEFGSSRTEDDFQEIAEVKVQEQRTDGNFLNSSACGNMEKYLEDKGSSDKRRTTNRSSEDLSTIKVQWELFRQVAKVRVSIFIYMALFTISGSLISLKWTYFFVYLKRIYARDFVFISGFAMMIESLLGELPFFLLSDLVIGTFGKLQTLSLSFISLSARFLLYRYLLPNSSIYSVIIPEVLQGPSFSLFYVVMAEVANEYSDCDAAISMVIEKGLVPETRANVDKLRQALRATMQSIVISCYEGLGIGLGSIIGGLAIQHYGFNDLWLYSAMASLFVGLSTILFATRIAVN